MAQGELAVLGGVPCDVLVEEGRIAALGAGLAPRRGAPRLDAAGLVVAPGFIDLQVNGGYGIDLTAEPERVGELAQRLLAGGVTAFLPTLVSPTEEEIRRALAVPTPLGWHLEGPLLNPARRGAHPRERLGPLPPSAFSPGVALVTLAPEQPGAAQAAAALAARGVVVAAGHTEATPAQLAAAGVRYVTHLFNAMAELHHRRPGPVGWALGAPIATVGLIADGRHVDPVAFAAAWAALGPRANLVSDASAGLGLPPGPCTLAGAPARVGGDGAVRRPDGALAGSALRLDQAVRNAMAWTGCGLAAAVAAVTAAPAALVGAAERGRLAVGARADLTLLTPDAQVAATVLAGELVYRGPHRAG